MTGVVSAISDVASVVGEVFSIISGNAYLTFFCAAGLLGVAIGVFNTLKNAVQ